MQTPEHTLPRSCRARAAIRPGCWCSCCGTWASRRGSCPAICIQLAADVKSLDGPSGPEKDFTDLHAWCEVYLPGAGWIGLDPTSGLLAGEGHIPLACTPEPCAAAPITGAVDEAKVEFSHHMNVERIWEAPRVTKPYTRRAVDRDRGAGSRDRRAAARRRRAPHDGRRADVRLARRSGWRRVEHRRARARQARARRRALRPPQAEICAAGPGAFRPGQVVSGRAAAALVAQLFLAARWRADLAQPRAARRRNAADRGVNADDREPLPRGGRASGSGFRRSSCSRRTKTRSITCGASAGCRPTSIRSSRSSRMPSSVRGWRACSSRVSMRSSATCCRVARDADRRALANRPWFLRRERCYLIPGDSPLGLRLPLDSLPWVEARGLPLHRDARPDGSRRSRSPRTRRHPRAASRARPRGARERQGARSGALAPSIGARWRRIRALRSRARRCAPSRATACSISSCRPRDGSRTIWSSSPRSKPRPRSSRTPVVLEGYEPPKDPRLE